MSDIESLRTSALASIEAAGSTAELEELRVQLLGKKGAVTGLLKGLGALSSQERPAAGAQINQLKEVIGEALSERKVAIGSAEALARTQSSAIDVTLPGRAVRRGAEGARVRGDHLARQQRSARVERVERRGEDREPHRALQEAAA